MKSATTTSPHQDGFSMIEVSLALAIVGIAMVSILGLFAVGLDSVKDGADDNMAAQLVQSVINDRRSSPFDSYTPGTNTFVPASINSTTFCIPPLSSDAKTNEFPYTLYFKKGGGTPLPRWSTIASVNASNAGRTNAQYYYVVDVQENPDTQAMDGFKILDIRVSWPSIANITNRTVYFYTTSITRH